MRIKPSISKFIVAGFSVFAATLAYGQTTRIWTNAVGGDIATAANWDPNGVASAATGDIMQWNGTAPGNLALTYNTGLAGGAGNPGVNFRLTSAQTGSVAIDALGTAAIRMNGITISNGAGAFTLGDGAGTFNLTLGGAGGQTHTWVNNSAIPATVNSEIIWTMGGGNTHILAFDGSGDWIVNKYLQAATGGGAALRVAKSGSGTLVLTKGGVQGPSANPSILINGGKVSIRSDTIVAAQIITNNAVLEIKSPVEAIALTGVISGTGTVAVATGRLTLSANSTFSGSIVVSNTGTLIAGPNNNCFGPSTLNVIGGVDLVGLTPSVAGLTGTGSVTNSFGSTATLTINNIAASTFSGTLADGDPGQTVALTKSGPGTFALAGNNNYTGLTTVNAGKLLFQSPLAGGGDVLVADSATLAVSGTQLAVNNMSLGVSSGATLEFNGVSSTTTAPIIVTNLTPTGTLTVNVNSGTLTVGQSYPLLTWIGGTAPTATLGFLNGYGGNLSVVGSTLFLNITSAAYIWSGANNGNWDTTTANNWLVGGSPAAFANGNPAKFDDSASGTTVVTVNATVTPTSILVDNSTKTYSVASSSGKVISGTTALVKTGTNTLTLSGGLNDFTGVTTISGGTVSIGTLANGGAASDIGASDNTAASLLLNGGTLKYTGGAASIDRLFSVGLNGGTLEVTGSGALDLNNTGAMGLSGSGVRTLTITGARSGNNILAATLADNGGATALIMAGDSKWILSGANTHSGGTSISNGLVQLGSDSGLGTGPLTVDGRLDLAGFNPNVGTLRGSGVISNSSTTTATLTTGSGASSTFSGVIIDGGAGQAVALVKQGGGTITLLGTNTYTGGTTINAGGLQLGNGGTSGSIVDAPLLNNGSLIVNRSDTITLGSEISGIGTIQHSGVGTVRLMGANTYSADTVINGAGTGTLVLGNNSALGAGTGYRLRFIATGTLLSSDATSRTIANDVWLESGGGTVAYGSVGTGDFTFTGSYNTGNGGKALAISNATTTVTGLITDNGAPTGAFSKTGPGTLVLAAGSSSPGINKDLAVLNGPLVLDGPWGNALGGIVTVSSGGTLAGTGSIPGVNASGLSLLVNAGGGFAPGGVGSIGTFAVTGSVTNSGNLYIALNKSLSQSNSFVTVGGSISLSNATLIVSNLGPALVVGDTFTLFDHAVADVTGMTIVPPVGSGIAFTNKLAVDGSITVIPGVATNPTNITMSVSGNQLVLSWPTDHTGWHLQSQTNSLSVGLGNNWVTVPGTQLVNSYTNLINPANGSVFYRLIYP